MPHKTLNEGVVEFTKANEARVLSIFHGLCSCEKCSKRVHSELHFIYSINVHQPQTLKEKRKLIFIQIAHAHIFVSVSITQYRHYEINFEKSKISKVYSAVRNTDLNFSRYDQ